MADLRDAVTAPTIRGVVTVLRAAGHRSYEADRRRRCPARGYCVRAAGDAIEVKYQSGHGGAAHCDTTLAAWAEALSRWDVTRTADGLLVRGRVTP